MSDEIQVRSKCTNDCVNGTTSHDYGNGDFELHSCIVCSGKGYTYRWAPIEEIAWMVLTMPTAKLGTGNQQPAEAA